MADLTGAATAQSAAPAPEHIVDTLIAERAPNLAASPLWPVLRPLLYSFLDYRKARRMAEWIQETRVIVATNALGLGIDIPDVRLVVHAGLPRRLRDYAQESGRGGRDAPDVPR